MLQLRKKRTGLGAHPVPLQNAENNLKYRGKTRAFLLTLCQEFWNLGRLLTRVMRDPDHALVVATGTAFVFAFVHQLARGKNRGGFPVDTP